MNTLNAKQVLIVGGSSGIGAATARAFATLGAHVTIASRTQAKLDVVATDIGAGVSAAILDTTSDNGVKEFFESAGYYDHIVISAAETPTGPARNLALADAYAAMNSKFWGAYRIARAAKIADGLPARRIGQPEDIANAILYPATTPYATGSTVLVDGGGAIA